MTKLDLKATIHFKNEFHLNIRVLEKLCYVDTP